MLAKRVESLSVQARSTSWYLDHQNGHLLIRSEIVLNVDDNERPGYDQEGDDSGVVCHGVSVD